VSVSENHKLSPRLGQSPIACACHALPAFAVATGVRACLTLVMASSPVADPNELWARLEALPANVKGEIIDGELHVQPRARFRHVRATGFLGRHLGGAFDYDEGGLGGWWIVPEPGIELPGAPEVSPDVAGWRHSTMPAPPPEGEPIRHVPDWVCEVLSPSNARYDQLIKFPFYARVGVTWLWRVDLRDQTLQVLELVGGAWVIRATCSEEAAVRLPPFDAIELPIARMWIADAKHNPPYP
jgi:Uma2 family endonuclease